MKKILQVYHKVSSVWIYLSTLIQMKFLRFAPSIIYMMNIPEHRNIGDQAIVLAEQQFFRYYFPKYRYVQVTYRQWELCKRGIEAAVREKDLVCIHGGGYIGDLWPGAERLAKEIIEEFPGKKKIMMPNTIFYYEDNPEIVKKKLSYYHKGDVHLFLRDKYSYDIAWTSGLRNITLVPDTVTFMEESNNKNKVRQGVLFCLRSDKERAINDEKVSHIKHYMNTNQIPYSETDTLDRHGVRSWNRARKVQKKLDRFRQAAIVVTDRLHGMYFCAITGTPCIAIDNISKKVSGGAEWVKHLPYIHMISDGDEQLIKDIIKQRNILSNKYFYKREKLMKYFDIEAEEICKYSEIGNKTIREKIENMEGK